MCECPKRLFLYFPTCSKAVPVLLCGSAMLAACVAVIAAMSAEPSPPAEATSEAPVHHELIQFFVPMLQMLEHLEPDELVLLVTTLFPVTYGLIAAFRSFTNNEGGGNDDDDAETGTVAELSTQAEAAIAQSVSSVGRLEQQVDNLQRANDTRFADLHKDLAGIVWELSKLRADMARWQVRSARACCLVELTHPVVYSDCCASPAPRGPPYTASPRHSSTRQSATYPRLTVHRFAGPGAARRTRQRRAWQHERRIAGTGRLCSGAAGQRESSCPRCPAT